MTPFAEAGARLLAGGYSPIPIVPGDKMPGQFVNGSWRLMRGWNDHCSAPPSAFQVKMWSMWPDAGIGVACGNGLIAIDIDMESLVAPITERLPRALVAKRGAKGLTLFYRGDTDKIRSRNVRIDGVGAVDILAWGKQTVLPPSIHPRTGEPYTYTTDETLEDVAKSDLTEITVEDMALLMQILREHGYKDERNALDDVTAPEFAASASDDERTFYRSLNEDALANLDLWVPKLGFQKVRKEGSRYRAVPEWRSSSSGRDISRRGLNLSIAPSGIQDFGTGETFTALNVVMRMRDLSPTVPDQLEMAVRELGAWLGYNFNPVHIERGTKRSIYAKSERLPPHDPETGEVLEAERPALTIAEPAPEPQLPALIEEELPPSSIELESFTFLPGGGGLVGRIVDWIEGCSRRPSRPLALGAALTFVGTLAGRWHGGPTDTRTNLYFMALAPSGFGKDHSRKCIKRLAAAAGLMNYIGADRIMSNSGLRVEIEQKPSHLILMDEVHGFIRTIMDRRASEAKQQIREDLLQYFGTAASTFNGAAYASSRPVTIYNPNLSIYGTSTPDAFWSSLSAAGVGDGFLPRLIVMCVDGEAPEDTDPADTSRAVPDDIIEACRALLTLSVQGNMAEASVGEITPRFADWTPGAKQMWHDIAAYCDRMERQDKSGASVLWSRVGENSLKLAHIVAVGIDPMRPVLTEELVEWAGQFLIAITRKAISELRERLASTDKQAEYLKVRRMIRNEGTAGLSAVALKKGVNGEFDTRRLEDILKQLEEAGVVEKRLASGPRGGKPGLRYFYVDTEELAAA